MGKKNKELKKLKKSVKEMQDHLECLDQILYDLIFAPDELSCEIDCSNEKDCVCRDKKERDPYWDDFDDDSDTEWSIFEEIDDVIFNDKDTVIKWSDGTHTSARCTKSDEFLPYAGLAVAIVKKVAGNRSVNHMLRKLEASATYYGEAKKFDPNEDKDDADSESSEVSKASFSSEAEG